jgi:hypothetical protein
MAVQLHGEAGGASTPRRASATLGPMLRRPVSQVLFPAEAKALHAQGYRLIRGGLGRTDLDHLRDLFDQATVPSHAWPVPRGGDWRHAQLDLDPRVQAACRGPELLDCAWTILQTPFFLAQVEGREPCPGGGAQTLHRDVDTAHASVANALIYLDDYGPQNGATRLAPKTHATPGEVAADAPLTLQGHAGDILAFDARLLHGATANHSGARRRTLLATYVEAAQLDAYRQTSGLRGVRMTIDQLFVREVA